MYISYNMYMHAAAAYMLYYHTYIISTELVRFKDKIVHLGRFLHQLDGLLFT